MCCADLPFVVLPGQPVNRARRAGAIHPENPLLADSKGYDPPFNPANFPSPRIFVFA
jgi:hypothetical protein